MKSGSDRYALAACAFVLVLTACNSGGAQVTPLGSTQNAAPFEPAKNQSTVPTSVKDGTQRVSPDGIVYTSAKVKIDNSQFNLDLNNDGTTDFVIAEGNSKFITDCGGHGGRDYNEVGELSLAPEGSNGFEVNGYYAEKLSSGSLIGATQSFSSVKTWIEYRWELWDNFCVHSGGESGNWRPNSRGYLGLAFMIDGQIHYGWAALIVRGHPLPNTFLHTTLTGYAYQTKVGEAIRAGEK